MAAKQVTVPFFEMIRIITINCQKQGTVTYFETRIASGPAQQATNVSGVEPFFTNLAIGALRV